MSRRSDSGQVVRCAAGRRKQTPLASLLRPAKTDRLRLDVVLADGREMLSWAGAPRFDEGEIDELIPDGAMGTGPFAAMLLGVFRDRTPRFIYEGDTKIGGRKALEYSFVAPVEESHYRVKAGTEWIITAYTGKLWVDPDGAELLRMAIRTDELPPATNSCETTTTLEFNTVQLGKTGYLLPAKSIQRFIGRDASESENTIEFASCRDIRGNRR